MIGVSSLILGLVLFLGVIFVFKITYEIDKSFKSRIEFKRKIELEEIKRKRAELENMDKILEEERRRDSSFRIKKIE